MSQAIAGHWHRPKPKNSSLAVRVTPDQGSTEAQNTESLLLAAGFRTQAPSTQAQLARYNRAAPYKLERNTISGQALYSYSNKKDAELGVAQLGLGNALLGVEVPGGKSFHLDQPDVDAAVVQWGVLFRLINLYIDIKYIDINILFVNIISLL